MPPETEEPAEGELDPEGTGEEGEETALHEDAVEEENTEKTVDENKN